MMYVVDHLQRATNSQCDVSLFAAIFNKLLNKESNSHWFRRNVAYVKSLWWSDHGWLRRRIMYDHAPFVWLIEAEWRIYASVNEPALDQIMACRLFGAHPLSEPVLEYC